MKDCKDYFLETSRRVSFEYTLLGTEVSFGEISLWCAMSNEHLFCIL